MAETESTRGGKRPGAGRKPLPPGEVRDQVFSIRLTVSEKELLESTNATKWAREALVRAAKRRSESGDRGS